MKNFHKCLLATILALLCAFSFAACNSNDGSDNNGNSGGGTDVTDTTDYAVLFAQARAALENSGLGFETADYSEDDLAAMIEDLEATEYENLFDSYIAGFIATIPDDTDYGGGAKGAGIKCAIVVWLFSTDAAADMLEELYRNVLGENAGYGGRSGKIIFCCPYLHIPYGPEADLAVSELFAVITDVIGGAAFEA